MPVRYLFVLLLISCSAAAPQYEIVKEPVQYEYLDREEARLENVLGHPTNFELDPIDARAGWARAKLFFHELLDRPDIQPRTLSEGFVLSNQGEQQGEKSPLIFKVFQYPSTRGSVLFEVRCRRRGRHHRSGDPVALQNAHNLARFIREGRFERDLLIR